MRILALAVLTVAMGAFVGGFFDQWKAEAAPTAPQSVQAMLADGDWQAGKRLIGPVGSYPISRVSDHLRRQMGHDAHRSRAGLKLLKINIGDVGDMCDACWGSNTPGGMCYPTGAWSRCFYRSGGVTKCCACQCIGIGGIYGTWVCVYGS